MLRMQFMPSDFDPQLLVLGDKADMGAFANLLAQFAIHPAGATLNQSGVFSEDTIVNLQPYVPDAGMALGLCRDAGDTGDNARLTWSLTPELASKFSTAVRKIAADEKLSGSAFLEVETLNEIRVHASTGEFEADFLTGDAR